MKTDQWGRKYLRDYISGEMICVDNGAWFHFESIMLTTAYFEYCGITYRFNAAEAKMAGLLTDEQWLGKAPKENEEEEITVEIIQT